MQFEFHTLDVFTSTRLHGNPVAIVSGADELEPEQMQAIAREFNLSETVFVCAAENQMHSARIRIFTPGRELPFAGHPTVGAAALIAYLKHGDEVEHEAIVTLEEEIGLVRAGVVITPDAPLRAEFDVPELPSELGEVGSRDDLAAGLGLTPVEIGFDNHRASVYSAGVPFIFAPVRDLDSLARARPVDFLWKTGAFAEYGAAYLYCRETREPGHSFSARMFSPQFGMSEDPATGSAAAAFAGVVQRFEALGGDRHVLTIEQGYDMGRPSLIELEVETEAGRLSGVRIAGECVLVSKGELTI